MNKILLIISLMGCGFVYGQDSTNPVISLPELTVSGYVEVYYSYDFNKPINNDKAGFLYSHNRHNEFNINLGYIKAAYADDRIRANLSLATGTYINSNYAAEPGVLKNIYEANAGIKLSKKKNIWLDAGVFSSHIGFESAASKDCWTLTRSMVAENSPYFESGAKITYTTDNNKWLFSILALNGWQRIQRVDGNLIMSFGTQIQYKHSSAITLNYSSFIGSDKPESARLIRYYHNLYAILNLGKIAVSTGFDIGMEQQSKGASSLNTWYAPVLILKYPIDDHWSIAARAEYYQDKHGVIIAVNTPNGFKTTGYSFNIDYLPVPNAVVRLEARTLHSEDAVFLKSSGMSNNNSFITSSIAISF
ncbi:MAG: porin [Flavitalea sp.]